MANLKKVKIIRKGETEDSVVIVNVEKYLKRGTPRGLIIDSDNIVIVPVKKSGALSKTWGVLREVVTVAGAAAGIYLLVHTLREDE